MEKLNSLNFIDLYLGRDYYEIKGLKGASTFLSELPESYKEDADKLKHECEGLYKTTHRTEFSVKYEGRVYRITIMCNLFDGISFVIRQTPAGILDFEDINLTTHLRRSIELPAATGLCLIAGEMGCGKTTTAASVLRHRISTTGSLGVSIEDPIETLLHGRHGQGRCMQMEVGQGETYSSATIKAMRTGASCLLLGEIRDSQTAHEVLKASLTMFVVSTIHASSIFEAIERYVMFCEEININAKHNVANTLYIVAHQTMTTTYREGNIANRNVNIVGCNLVNCKQQHTIKSKISQGSYKALVDEFNSIEYTF